MKISRNTGSSGIIAGLAKVAADKAKLADGAAEIVETATGTKIKYQDFNLTVPR